MNSQILSKLNNFMKNRLIELIGILLTCFGIFVLSSILSYSPSDPNFIYSNENTEIKNFGGFYGSVISDFLLQSLGLISLLFVFNFIYWGIKLFLKKKVINFTSKIFFTLIYIILGTTVLNILHNDSFYLIDNGNGGFVGRIVKENIYYLTPLIENNYTIYILIFFTFLFFILSLGIKYVEIYQTLIFPFKFINRIASLFKSKKNKTEDILKHADSFEEDDNLEDVKSKIKQPILPFTSNKKIKSSASIFKLPQTSFLEKNDGLKNKKNTDNVELVKNSEFLEKILLDFGVEGKIKRVSCGPVVTLNEFEPASGVKVSKIVNLADDIARNTSSVSARVATIPGKNTIGIEIPNAKRENVFLSEIITDDRFNKREMELPIALGKSISGIPVVGDLSSMPHLLIAGTTGSGKSVCINTIILSLLYKYTPEKCNLILIDPKMLELSAYEGIPHLLCPVITEAKKATAALGWAVKEMESRY